MALLKEFSILADLVIGSERPAIWHFNKAFAILADLATGF